MSSSRIIKGNHGAPGGFSFPDLDRGADAAAVPEEAHADEPFIPLYILEDADEFVPDVTHHPVVQPVMPALPAVEDHHQPEHEEEPQPQEQGNVFALPDPEELQRVAREAYLRGVAAGQQQAEEALAESQRMFDSMTSELEMLRRRVMHDAEEDLLKLSLAICRRILQRELAQDRRILARFIAESLAAVPEREDVILRLHPDDHAMVHGNRQLFLPPVEGRGQVIIRPDEAVSPGGCIAECGAGVADARLETQLDVIFRRVIEEMSGPQEQSPPPGAGTKVYQGAKP